MDSGTISQGFELPIRSPDSFVKAAASTANPKTKLSQLPTIGGLGSYDKDTHKKDL